MPDSHTPIIESQTTSEPCPYSVTPSNSLDLVLSRYQWFIRATRRSLRNAGDIWLFELRCLCLFEDSTGCVREIKNWIVVQNGFVWALGFLGCCFQWSSRSHLLTASASLLISLPYSGYNSHWYLLHSSRPSFLLLSVSWSLICCCWLSLCYCPLWCERCLQ